MQTFQLLTAKTLIPPETSQIPVQLSWFHIQPEATGNVINKLNILAFSIRETHAAQTQYFKLWVQSHHSGVSQLQSQVSYHLGPEQWLWICHFWTDQLLLWIPPTFCGHLAGYCRPISRSLSSLTPNKILQVVLDKLKGHSIIASNILPTSVRTSTTYDTCGCCNIWLL